MSDTIKHSATVHKTKKPGAALPQPPVYREASNWVNHGVLIKVRVKL